MHGMTGSKDFFLKDLDLAKMERASVVDVDNSEDGLEASSSKLGLYLTALKNKHQIRKQFPTPIEKNIISI